MLMRGVAALAALAFATGCKPSTSDSATAVQQRASVDRYDPARDLGPLFHDVQLAGVFEDSKTFVDARPRSAPAAIVEAICRRAQGERVRPARVRRAELRDSAARGDGLPHGHDADDGGAHPRAVARAHAPRGPCGRALVADSASQPVRRARRTISRSVLLGLVFHDARPRAKAVASISCGTCSTTSRISSRRSDTSRTATARTTWAGASRHSSPRWSDCTRRPPTRRRRCAISSALEAEHAFWMDGADRADAGAGVSARRDDAGRSRVESLLGRSPGPRPESYRADFELAQTLPDSARDRFYRNVRAAAESGWDFSSRWMRDPSDLRTLETTELIPIDLNSLMYNAERTIAALRSFRKQAGRRRRRGAVQSRARSAGGRRCSTAAYEPGMDTSTTCAGEPGSASRIVRRSPPRRCCSLDWPCRTGGRCRSPTRA